MLQTLQDKFYGNFIEENRWEYILDGLGVTLQVTFFAVIIGIVIGFLIAIIRSTYDKTGKLKILNFICKIYLTVIRGTPVVVQLLIIYFVIFGSADKMCIRDSLYMKLFCKKSDTAKQYVQQWLPIVAAAQLTKDNELEKDFLMKWIDVIDYQ